MDKLLSKMEDMTPEERKNLRKMLSEKGGSKDEAPMGWMYKEDQPESEEYLLGRRIDKHIDKDEEEDKTAPGALFKDAMARRADLDMQAKIREDPLYAIRQKEEDARKKLLQNPIKMKQLQQMIETDGKHKKKKKEKKKKKHKKKATSDDSDSDSDDELMKKYMAILEAKKSKHKADTSGGEDSHRHKKHKKHKKEKKRLSSSESEEERPGRSLQAPPGYGLIKPTGEAVEKPSRRRSRSRSPRRRSRSPRRNRSRSPKRQRSTSPKARGRGRSPPKHKQETKKRLTDAEKEERRRQMMADAAWRDEQRVENVRRYKEEDQREEDAVKHRPKGASASDFINPLMMKHADTSSVSERLQRNRHHLQRTGAALNDNSYVK